MAPGIAAAPLESPKRSNVNVRHDPTVLHSEFWGLAQKSVLIPMFLRIVLCKLLKVKGLTSFSLVCYCSI